MGCNGSEAHKDEHPAFNRVAGWVRIPPLPPTGGPLGGTRSPKPCLTGSIPVPSANLDRKNEFIYTIYL